MCVFVGLGPSSEIPAVTEGAFPAHPAATSTRFVQSTGRQVREVPLSHSGRSMTLASGRLLRMLPGCCRLHRPSLLADLAGPQAPVVWPGSRGPRGRLPPAPLKEVPFFDSGSPMTPKAQSWLPFSQVLSTVASGPPQRRALPKWSLEVGPS